MEDAQDLDEVALNTVGHDVGRARNDQFAGAGPSAGTASVRHLSKHTDRGLDALYDARRRLGLSAAM
jgi:hypothetical protein